MNDSNEVITLNINDVLPNRFQPRIKFNEEKINELSESIRKYGVIQPIIVRKIGKKYEIIAGERRYKASMMAGLSEIPALINNLSDEDSSEVALIENVQRENLTPTEEAISYKRILDMGYMTQDSLAKKLGVSQSAVANKLRLLNLTEEVQEALLENKISERHARSLLRLKSHLDQEDMLKELLKNRYTVRQLDKKIEEFLSKTNNFKIPSILRNNENKDVQKDNSEENQKSSNNKEVKVEIDNSNIEVLDLINNINKEVINVNNDNINMFQVPNVPIENDQPIQQTQPVQPIQQVQPVEPIKFEQPVMPVGTNPGFMDIDKIEKEATDISILNPNLNNNNVIPVQPVVPQQTGKFFDMSQTQGIQNNNVKEPSSTINEQIVPNVFEMPIIEPVTQVQEVVTPQTVTPSFEMPVIEPVVQKQTPVTSTISSFEMPVTEPVTSSFEMPVTEPVTSSFEMPITKSTLPVSEVTPVQPVMPASESIKYEQPVVAIQEPITPVQEPISLQTVSDPFAMPSMESITPIINPVIEPKEEKLVESVEPIQPIPVVKQVLNNQINETVVPQQVTIPTPVQTEPINSLMRNAINEIRQISDKFEAEGLNIEMDEMDLPYSYVVTFKINK